MREGESGRQDHRSEWEATASEEERNKIDEDWKSKNREEGETDAKSGKLEEQRKHVFANPKERSTVLEKNESLAGFPSSLPNQGGSSALKNQLQRLWSRFFGPEQTNFLERKRRQAASSSSPLPEAEPTEELLVEEPKKGPR